MNWLTVTLFAYFLLAFEIILDKFLLSSKRVSHPVIYAFYAGVLALAALLLIPFGFHRINFSNFLYLMSGGVVFIYGMFSLFSAINKSEASRVTPVVGAVTPIVIFFLSSLFLGEHLRLSQLWGLIILIFGGLWISYDFSHEREQIFFKGFYWSILAGTLLAIAATMFKGSYNRDNFYNVFAWRGIGEFLGALTFLLIPAWREKIIGSLLKFKKPEAEHQTSGAVYVISRAIGGIGSVLKERATAFTLASVTIVNAMVSVEYVFVFILGVFFSVWFPKVFSERKDWKSIMQKIIAIIVITAGLVMTTKN